MICSFLFDCITAKLKFLRDCFIKKLSFLIGVRYFFGSFFDWSLRSASDAR